MILNIQDISSKLKSGEEVNIKESSLKSDMIELIDFYKNISQDPSVFKTLIEEEGEDILKFASLYFQTLLKNEKSIEITIKDQLVTLTPHELK